MVKTTTHLSNMFVLLCVSPKPVYIQNNTFASMQ